MPLAKEHKVSVKQSECVLETCYIILCLESPMSRFTYENIIG